VSAPHEIQHREALQTTYVSRIPFAESAYSAAQKVAV
jgi:hypothetical protein